ncbi:Sodium/calcium exchanger protein [Subdoligranulum variabile DSM 15176]|uniref:Sodium/calcium exchanger protein n=2 Tax=Subdoligranulum variabile TaxID=214851 RepID=D1PNY4_9FIRM|nr:Sodium/calcium exchanger protein [Subdoligranulum variabile DSM 15176]
MYAGQRNALPFLGKGTMPVLLLTLLIYVLTAVGSRLAGRCTTWCCALCGLPMWVVGGTVAPFCLALPQLMLAFLAAGLSITGLAVGTALAGAVASLGLALAVCLLNPRHTVTVDRSEFLRKCLLLLAACGVLVLFVRDGTLSYTGTGLLMFLFVLFVLISIVYQHHYIYGEGCEMVSTKRNAAAPPPESAAATYGYTAHTMAFPVMSVPNALKNLGGVIAGLVLLAGGAQALVYSAASLANLTGTIQALWAATLISFGFCLPLLADALDHPFGSAWKRFSVRCRYFPPRTLPMQLINSAILNLTLALPISSLMYRERLPFGSQFRHYDLPICAAMTLILLLPPLLRRRLYRWQGSLCLVLYLLYLAAAWFLPLSGA